MLCLMAKGLLPLPEGDLVEPSDAVYPSSANHELSSQVQSYDVPFSWQHSIPRAQPGQTSAPLLVPDGGVIARDAPIAISLASSCAAQRRLDQPASSINAAAEQAEQKRAEETRERERREAEQAQRLEDIKAQEEELLEARSAPLRAYLMKHVIPTLTEGLIETCKVMPEDPVDYLAEYMFRASPAVEQKTSKK